MPSADASADVDAPRSAPLEAHWLGRVAYDEAHVLQQRLAAERADGLIGDQLLLLEHPAVLTLGRNSDPAHILASRRRTRGPGHRGRPGRARRRGHLPRARPARGLPDRRAARARPAPPTLRACAGGRARRDVRRARRRGGPSRRPPRLLVRPGRTPARARSERSDCGSSAGSPITASRSTSPSTSPTSTSSMPCGMPGVVSTSIATRARRRAMPRPRRHRSRRRRAIFARAFADAIDAPLVGELPA